MGDGHGFSPHPILRFKPRRDTSYQTDDQLAAMRSRFWITHPFRQRFGLLRLHLVERAPAPSPIIAFTQHRLDDCAELQGLSGLNGPQRGTAPASIRVAQATLDNSELFPSLRLQLLVRRKRRCPNGRGRCVANKP